MEILIFLAIGILGILGHSVMKADSLMKDAKVANMHYTVKNYLKDDWAGISLSFIWLLVWLMIWEEPARKYPGMLDWIRLTFLISGMLGSYIFQTLFSKGKKKIRSVVDEKTDIADRKS